MAGGNLKLQKIVNWNSNCFLIQILSVKILRISLYSTSGSWVGLSRMVLSGGEFVVGWFTEDGAATLLINISWLWSPPLHMSGFDDVEINEETHWCMQSSLVVNQGCCSGFNGQIRIQIWNLKLLQIGPRPGFWQSLDPDQVSVWTPKSKMHTKSIFLQKLLTLSYREVKIMTIFIIKHWERKMYTL